MKTKIVAIVAFAPLFISLTAALLAYTLAFPGGCNVSAVGPSTCIVAGVDISSFLSSLFMISVMSIIAIPWAIGVFVVAAIIIVLERYTGFFLIIKKIPSLGTGGIKTPEFKYRLIALVFTVLLSFLIYGYWSTYSRTLENDESKREYQTKSEACLKTIEQSTDECYEVNPYCRHFFRNDIQKSVYVDDRLYNDCMAK